MSPHIETAAANGRGTITIDNPEKRNALSPSSLTRLATAAADLAERDDITAVVVRSAGDHVFSAGYDTDAIEDREERQAGDRAMIEASEAIAALPMPTLAAVDGPVYGAAVSLLAACDLRFASASATVCVPTVRIGVIYPIDAIERLVRLVGPADTKELLFSGATFDAARAREMGLYNRVSPAEEFADTVSEFVERLVGNAPLSLSGTKRIVDSVAATGSLSPAEREGLERQRREAFQSDDFERGVAAFGTDDEPQFEGR